MIIHKTLASYWKVPQKRRKFHTVGEKLSTSYPIQDNKEKLVSVSALFRKNNERLYYFPPKEIKEIDQDFYLRAEAAEKLLQAAKSLPKNTFFYVSEGYRPLWFQRQEFDKIYAEMLAKYPQKSKKAVWELTTMYIADPDLSPPHSSGGTLDLTLCNDQAKQIDMGNPMNTVDAKSNTFTRQITKRQKENRMLLFDTLTSHDFVNIPSEWWHFSHGDQYWALYKKEKFAKYGPIDMK